MDISGLIRSLGMVHAFGSHIHFETKCTLVSYNK